MRPATLLSLAAASAAAALAVVVSRKRWRSTAAAVSSSEDALASGAKAQAQAARAAARALQVLSHAERVSVLHAMADALENHSDEICAANERDVAAYDGSGSLAARLVLSPKKLSSVAAGIRSLAAQPNPLGRVRRHIELAAGLTLTQETVPIGVLLVIFESRPDVLPQVAALAIASGNGVLLKGGKEATWSNGVLHRTLGAAVERASAGRVPAAVLGLVEGRAAIGALLQLHDELDLVIPRGSNALVQHVMSHTRIPTLGHADGICHVYIDAAAALEKAVPLMLDAKTDYPAACNALETLLVHQSLVSTGGAAKLLEAARAAGIRVYGGPRACAALPLPAAESLRIEYGELAMAFELVSSVEAAIEHIHAHGSGHTDVIVTEDVEAAEAFLSGVDSADVFHNASSRFADGYRFGLGAEVGISTSRIHARGPVGVEGLLTTRNRLVSTSAHIVSDFSSGRRQYTHKDLLGAAA